MPKVRKWYSSLEKWEEDRYWACFRFLYLMKPDEKYEKDDYSKNIKRGDQKFNYYIPDSLGYHTLKHQCTSKHDELVAIHATCCEHRTNFFGYFHRNYLIYVEMYLDKADKILRASNKYFDVLVSQEELQLMRKEYKGILSQAKGEIGPITIPCWDILRTREEIKLPEILRKSKTDIFEKCLERVTGANLGLFDPRKMWYTGCYHDQADNFLKIGISQTQRKSYQDSQPINLNEKCDDDINKFYGNGKYNFFKEPRISNTSNQKLKSVVYSYQKALSNDDLLSGAIENNKYNDKKGSDGFFTRKELSLEYIHDYMHNTLEFSMKDPTFSILNPVFYLYHATIDYMLELKLRLVQEDIDMCGPKENILELNEFFGVKMQTISYLNIQKKELRKRIFDSLLKSSNYSLKYGDLFVYDWFNLKMSEIMKQNDSSDGGILYKDLIMQPKNGQLGLRLSYNLDELYKGSRYAKNIENAYEWSYDYEDFVNKEGQTIKVTIKKEIQQVIDYVQKNIRKQQNILERHCHIRVLKNDDEKRQRKPMMSTEEIIRHQAIQKIGPVEGVILLSENLPFLREMSWFYAKTKYRTDICSKIIYLLMEIKDPFYFPFINTPQCERSQHKYLFHSIPLFTKGKGSSSCPNCLQYEVEKHNIGRLFEGIYYPLYLDLFRATKTGVLYHNLNNGLPTDHSVTKFVRIYSSVPEQYNVQILEGAYEVSFKFILCQELPEPYKKNTIHGCKDYSYKPIDQSINYKIYLTGYVTNFDTGESHQVLQNTFQNQKQAHMHFKKAKYYRDAKQVFGDIEEMLPEEEINDYIYQGFSGQVRLSDKFCDNLIKFDFKLKLFCNYCPTYLFYVSSRGEIVVVDQNFFMQQAALRSIEVIFNSN